MPLCKINFHDLQNNVIFSGQLLRGSVALTLDKETTTGPIYIRLSGKTVYKKERSKRTTKKRNAFLIPNLPWQAQKT